jgi:hypothetical protein
MIGFWFLTQDVPWIDPRYLANSSCSKKGVTCYWLMKIEERQRWSASGRTESERRSCFPFSSDQLFIFYPCSLLSFHSVSLSHPFSIFCFIFFHLRSLSLRKRCFFYIYSYCKFKWQVSSVQRVTWLIYFIYCFLLWILHNSP